MNCVFIGPWYYACWQQASMFITSWWAKLGHQASTLAQAMEGYLLLADDGFCKCAKLIKMWGSAAYKIPVPEYVKSWLRPRKRHLGKFHFHKPRKKWTKADTPYRISRFKASYAYSHQDCSKAYPAVAMKARTDHHVCVAKYDTDSRPIRIDNCASYCISYDLSYFITPLKAVNKRLKGLGGTYWNQSRCHQVDNRR